MFVSLHADDPPAARFVAGRADEQRLIADLVDAAVAGRGAAVVVRGEPGIGKTALLEAAAASRDDIAVRRVQCAPRYRNAPYRVIAEAVDGWSPAHDASRAAADLLGRLRAVPPTLLVVDDVHWADEASVDALAEISSHLGGLGLTILLAVRDHDVPPSVVGLIARLAAEGVLTEIVLGPLDRQAVDALAATLAGSRPAPALAAEIALAGGNPLHVIDICRARRRGVGDDAAADSFQQAVAQPSDPDAADDAPAALDGLSDDARRVLSVAALLGMEFGVRELCAVMGRSMTDLLAVVEESIASGIVGDGDGNRLVFKSERARAVLGSALPAGVRAELQREIAVALDRAGTSSRVVAAHLARANLQASDLDWVQTVGAQVLVADPPIAAALWSRLRAAVPDADRRSRAVDGELARAFLASGDLRRAEVTCRRAMRGAPPGLAGSLRLTLAATLMRQGRWAAVRAIGEAAADSRLVHPAERAEQMGIAATAALAGGDPDWALEAVERAERAAWATGVARVRGHTLAVRGHLAHLAGRLDEAASLLRDATALRGADGPVGDGTACVWLSFALADMDRFDDAAGVLDRALQTARGGASGRLEMLRARAWLRLDAGLIRDAVDILDSLPPPEWDDGPAARVVIARRALAGLFLDGVRGAEPWLQRLRGEPAASQACYGSAWVSRAIAARCAVDGDAVAERQALADGWAGCVDHGLSADLVVLAPHLAAVAAAAGDHAQAAAVVEPLRAIARDNSDVRTIQAAARATEAFAAQDPDALVEAARLWQASPRRLEAVRVARRVSDALVRLDRPQLAEMVGAESSRAYMAQGARMKADRGGLLSSEPAPPPARRRRNGRPTTGWDALTRAERVVATFVERGESNAEIAARLVLSRRTVESHVSNILAKLGMRSRSDLILAAASRTAPEPPPAAADGMGVVDTAPQ